MLRSSNTDELNSDYPIMADLQLTGLEIIPGAAAYLSCKQGHSYSIQTSNFFFAFSLAFFHIYCQRNIVCSPLFFPKQVLSINYLSNAMLKMNIEVHIASFSQGFAEINILINGLGMGMNLHAKPQQEVRTVSNKIASFFNSRLHAIKHKTHMGKKINNKKESKRE